MLFPKLIGAVAAAAFTLTGALSPAVAGGAIGYSGYAGHVSTSYGYGDDYGGGYGRGYGYGNDYRGGYGDDYHGGYRRHGGHHLGYLIPLALLGGYLIATTRSAPRQRVVYAPPPQAPRQSVWATPPVQTAKPYCREYTTNVTIGGSVHQAYGRACRQADGSWKIISRKLAPIN